MEMFSSNLKILMECLVGAKLLSIHFRDTVQRGHDLQGTKTLTGDMGYMCRWSLPSESSPFRVEEN